MTRFNNDVLIYALSHLISSHFNSKVHLYIVTYTFTCMLIAHFNTKQISLIWLVIFFYSLLLKPFFQNNKIIRLCQYWPQIYTLVLLHFFVLIFYFDFSSLPIYMCLSTLNIFLITSQVKINQLFLKVTTVKLWEAHSDKRSKVSLLTLQCNFECVD